MTDQRPATILVLLSAVLAIGIAGAAFLLAKDARQISRLQTDRAALSDIAHGALNGEQWVQRISPVLAERIRSFELDDETRPAAKALLVRIIERAMEEIPKIMLGGASPGGGQAQPQGQGLKGFVERLTGGAMGVMMDLTGIKNRAPELADTLLDELEKPETRKQLVVVVHNALSALMVEQMPPPDPAILLAIHARHGCGSTPECQGAIDTKMKPLEARSLQLLGGLAAAALTLLILAGRAYGRSPGLVAPILSVGALGLLGAGLLAPMIQIDARIAELDVQLLGASIRFEDQVLYFQSKSILDVVELLIQGREPDLLLVGGLIALFSIGFPVMKLVMTCLLAWRSNAGEPGPVMRFFAFHSAKWAMADVFVVALFMAYLGLNGLVSNQLATIQSSETVTVLSTNGTALEPGFWAFLMFAIFGMVMAILAQRTTKSRMETTA